MSILNEIFFKYRDFILKVDAMFYYSALKNLDTAINLKERIQRQNDELSALGESYTDYVQYYIPYDWGDDIDVDFDGDVIEEIERIESTLQKSYKTFIRAITATHLFCELALEAYINLIAKKLLKEELYGDFEALSLMDKWIFLPHLLNKDKFDTDSEVFQGFERISQISESIIKSEHYGDVWSVPNQILFDDSLEYLWGLELDEARNSLKTTDEMIHVMSTMLGEDIPEWLGKTTVEYIRMTPHSTTMTPKIISQELTNSNLEAWIITEGKTDWKHLKNALSRLKESGYFVSRNIQFWEYEDEVNMGDDQLMKMCIEYSKLPQSRRTIFIFDRDKAALVRKVSEEGQLYKGWGNNVFSFAIPIPEHRQDTPDISIEFYYHDAELLRKDSQNRRLYVSDEFQSPSGRHKTEDVNCMDRNKIAKSTTIIDAQVYDKDNRCIALTKNDFANNILTRIDNFSDFDVIEFKKIFDIVSAIMETS